MFYTRLLWFALLSCTFFTYSQEYTLQGIVLNTDGEAVQFANVLLLREADSTIAKGSSTEEMGTFLFNNVEGGKYILSISYLGYAKLDVPITVSGNLDTGPHFLDELKENLEEVNILVKRPTLTRQPDRLTFNVASTALIEGSILQVLRNTPSVLVIDGDIRIKNTSADVYINNRRVQLSPTELSEFLESSAANSIQSIEVINNPPASYDASSGAVINIVMSKNLIVGYRGSVAASYQQGVFPNYGLSTSHFFKDKNSNFNISYSYNDQKVNRDNIDVIDYFDMSNSISETWTSDINRNTYSDTHTLGLNYDISLDDRNSIIASANFIYVPMYDYNINNNTIITDNNGQLLTTYLAKNNSDDDKYNLNADLDYVHQFKNNGKLTLNGHFTLFDYNRFQLVDNEYYNSSGTLIESSLFNTDNNQNTTIFSSKIDYSLPIDDSSNFESGIKYTNISTDNIIVRNDIINGQEQINPGFTNSFDYNENIFAAFANYSKEWEKWSLNLGLRVENTDLNGVSSAENAITKQNYFSWFPNASILYNYSENLSFYTNYKRSITRPSFEVLNPFTFFLNENTLVVGNPMLQPIFTDYVEFGIEFLSKFTVSAYYKNLDDNFYELPRQDNETNIVTYTNINVDRTVDYGFDFSYNSAILDNWYLYFATSFYNWSDRIRFDNEAVEIDRWANYSVLNNNLSLLKDKSLSLDLTFWYVGKTIQGLALVEDRLFSSLAISKKILNDKGTLSLSAGDLFNASDPRAVTRYLNQSNVYDTDQDNRYVTLGFRYRFGNTKLETNEREVSTDEIKRLSKEEVKEQDN